MNTKKGLYHKKCFSCISCRSQLHYYGAIEGPDDEVYCRVCYLRAYGPGGKNKYGDATPYPVEDEECPEACVRCHSKVGFQTFKFFYFTYYRVFQVKVDETKQLFQKENMH